MPGLTVGRRRQHQRGGKGPAGGGQDDRGGGQGHGCKGWDDAQRGTGAGRGSLHLGEAPGGGGGGRGQGRFLPPQNEHGGGEGRRGGGKEEDSNRDIKERWNEERKSQQLVHFPALFLIVAPVAATRLRCSRTTVVFNSAMLS